MFKSAIEIHGLGWQRRIANLIRAAMILHNLFIDLGEPLEEPVKLARRVLPAVADSDEDPAVRDARVLRDRLALFVGEYFKMSPYGAVRRIKKVGE